MVQLSKFLFFIIFIFFIDIAVDAQNHYERLSKIDVQHYQFKITLSDESDVIKGETVIKIKFKQKLNKFTLDLANSMLVSKVMYKQKKIRFEQKNNKLIIYKKEIKKNKLYEFVIKYAGTPTDGLVISKNRYGERTFFGDNWPNRAHYWLPTVDHPSDKATFEFDITAPSHYKVISNGILEAEKKINKTTQLTEWTTNVPLSTKLMVIGVADFAVQKVKNFENIPIYTWVFKHDKEKGFQNYNIAHAPMSFFSKNIAAYPYKKLANVQSKTRYGGMENAGAIFYYENSVDGSSDLQRLFAHEIAHQWFGNSVSEANWHHIWLSEGFATYLTDLFLLDFYGEKVFITQLQSERKRVIRFAGQKLAPIVDTTVSNYNYLLNANSYQKGAWVLHMLRNKIGEKMFWKTLQLFYKRYKFSNAVSNDFVTIVNKVSKQNFTPFFEQWLYKAGHPILKTSIFDNKKKIVIEQTQTTIFKFPIEINIFYENGNSELIEVDIKQKKHIIETKNTVKKIELDPNTKCLFEHKK